MSKNKNPYQRGMYAKAFGWMQKKQVFTRSELVAFLNGEGLKDKAAASTAAVLLSPRESSKRGDCRGNASAKGQYYFVKPLAKVKGQEKKFRLFYRKVVLEQKVAPRSIKKEVKQEKGKAKKVKKAVKKTAPVTATTETVA